MTIISILVIGLVLLIANFVWHYLRFIGPYLKLPCSWAIVLDTIVLLICNTVKTDYAKKNILRKIEENCRKFEKEGMFVILLNEPLVCVFGQEFMKQILHESAAIDKPKLYHLVKYFFGNSIFLSNGETHKRHKKIVMQAFQVSLKKKKIQIFNKQSGNLAKTLSSLPNNTTNDVLDIMRHSTLQMIIESLFGIEKNFAERSLMIESLTKIFPLGMERFLKPWLYPDISLHIFPEGRKCLKPYKACNRMILEMVETLKESMLTSNKNLSDVKPGLMGEALLKEHLQDPSFTMDELVAQTITLINAALDTTAITLMWCLHLVGLHEEVQERILLEVEELNEDLCDEDLRKMEYTECVLRETLRMYATVPAVVRYLTEDVKCGKYTIPKGSNIFLLFSVLHKNADMFPDPEKFDPERFRKTESGNPRQFYTVSFSEGVRPCLGKADALNELKIVIAYIVRNFKVISLDKQEDVEVSYELLLNSAKPLQMQFIPRRMT